MQTYTNEWKLYTEQSIEFDNMKFDNMKTTPKVIQTRMEQE
jgi:hypothetical protein